MRKIPSLYLRDPDDMAHVTRIVNERCRWVIEGEGTPMVKWDGTCVMLDAHGQWWTRHQVRPDKTVPEYYILVEHDPVTGKTQGWIPAAHSSYAAQLSDAIAERAARGDVDPWLDWTPGTYELIGPKVGNNPHEFDQHTLIAHDAFHLIDIPTDYDALSQYLWAENTQAYLEGIVWHHPDGRMAKIKTKDFIRG